MANNDYTPQFLTAVAAIARRSENYWNAQAERELASDRASRAYMAKSARDRALEYRAIYFDAMATLDGCDASLASLDAYFDTDHLCLWAEAEARVRAMGRAAA